MLKVALLHMLTHIEEGEGREGPTSNNCHIYGQSACSNQNIFLRDKIVGSRFSCLWVKLSHETVSVLSV